MEHQSSLWLGPSLLFEELGEYCRKEEKHKIYTFSMTNEKHQLHMLLGLVCKQHMA
jgi:hypothetical protein